jgi:carboxylate-amine ligase
VTPKPAYLRLEHEYELVSREQVLCGCHVHVGITDPEVAIAVMNRIRPWLPVLLALSANSPFWHGEDSGYASFRTETWRRWPLAGPPDAFSSRAEYDQLVETLLAVQAIDDPARLYWDIRPSAKFATLEFRVADAGLTVDDTVTIAGLVRALVGTCHREVVEGHPAPSLRMELLRAAAWRAARYGLGGTLIDPGGRRSRPANDVVERLLEYVGPALSGWGDWDEIRDAVKRIEENGTGAVRQRAVYEATGSLEDVVDFLVAQTAPS